MTAVQSAALSAVALTAALAAGVPPGPNPLRTRRIVHLTLRNTRIELPPSRKPVLFDGNGVSELIDDETANECTANYPDFAAWAPSREADTPFPAVLTPSDAPMVPAPDANAPADTTAPDTTPEKTENAESEKAADPEKTEGEDSKGSEGTEGAATPDAATPPQSATAAPAEPVTEPRPAKPAPAPRPKAGGKIAGAPADTGTEAAH